MVTTRAQYGLATSHTKLDFSVCAGISYDFVHRNARGKFRMLFSHINSTQKLRGPAYLVS